MSRSLNINLVKTKSVGSNKCIPLMNYIEAQGSPTILDSSDIPGLKAIRDSFGGNDSQEAKDITHVIRLISDHGELEFEIVY